MSGTGIFDDSAAATGYSTVFGMDTAANNPAQQQMSQAQAAQQQQMMYNQQLQMAYGLARQKHEWMVNGVTMTFDDFLDTICPDRDDPHRTFLMLKYKGIK